MPTPPPVKGTLAFVTLGCAKNLVDSERMLGHLAVDGYAIVPEANGADVVVVNTCGFIEAARQESLGVIREMIDLKDQGKLKAVVVAGCLAERKKETLLDEVPGIDHLVGVFGREEITAVCDKVLDGKLPRPANDKSLSKRKKEIIKPSRKLSLNLAPPKPDLLKEQRTLFKPAPVRALPDDARLRITPRHFAYLKISEGCDRLCTFCAIPGMRGKHATKPIEQVVAEAKELARDGVRELNIVAQDSTYYGMDLYGKPRLDDLLLELNKVKGIDWIRVLYVYPMYLTDSLLKVLGSAKKIVPYIDMPLQHINDTMLKRMSRKVNRKQTVDLVQKLREHIPNLVLRTTFIVGFPGETEEQFQELCAFATEMHFERAGVFTYSFEPGTPATKLPDHLPEEVKNERRDRLMKTQQKVAFAWSQAQVGQTLDVLIDGPDPETPGWWLGRSYADAPDIDPIVKVKSKKIGPGDLVPVKITAAEGYDLLGKA
ncbi:MAG: 30S ribosomal protein S12 methylthiotransferase RimO [Planctomycetia bacterium]|nr:30S ribosomal protein S12 methylthiotransferase RimO [Planctomycetia bacterium]